MSQAPQPGEAVHRLADRLGLHRAYVSAAGDTRQVSDATLQALAAALGFPAAGEAEAGQSLQRLEGDGDAALDPVVVVRENEPVELHWGDRGKRLQWRVVLEDGGVREGEAEPAAAVEAPAATRRWRITRGDLPTGYHRLELRAGDATASTSLIVVPPRAYTPPEWDAGRRDWAITVQLYALRSARNWGIGDFSDLGELARRAAALGASAVGLNPLHALFPANPKHLSPYSPSSRAFLNPVYLDVQAVPEFAGCAEAQSLIGEADFQVRLQAARASEEVDYETVWALKLAVLRRLHRRLRQQRDLDSGNPRAAAFAAFRAAGGEALERFAVFEALQQHFVAQGVGLSWRDWPQPYRDADSAEVRRFAAEQAEAVEFSQFLQWEADRQLGLQADAMRDAGMTTGLYRDVAVGVDPNGAEAWGDRSLLIADAAVGAPPDIYNPKGQDWGLTPFSPVALEQRAYAPFIAAIRANMRHAGAIRIDHVIGLMRLYWVPRGMSADAGGYITYPYEQLMGIIALESWRHRCFVVGEDLGTVPEGFREDAEQRGLLSYRVLMFERENGDGAFLPPPAYPALAAAAVSTHDLPTLAGFWSGRDLQWRVDLNLYKSPEDAEREQTFRRNTRQALLQALVENGQLGGGAATALLDGEAGACDGVGTLAAAAHGFLAAAPCRLLLVQFEDLAGEVEQMNLPGTVDEHPNWRRRLQRSLDEVFDDAAVRAIAAAIQQTRPQAGESR